MPFRETGLLVDMDFTASRGLIGDRGTNMIHEIGVRCPCIRVSTEEGAVGHSDPSCVQCRGRGWMYRDLKYIRGLVTSMSANAHWAQTGWVYPGDLIFSTDPKARRISNFDRIISTVPQPTEGQVIVRGEDSVFSPRVDDLAANEDLLYWESGHQQALWVEDENGVVYVPGQYTLFGRKVQWVGTFGPSVGTKYGIKYEAFYEYLCWIPPTERWDHQRELGQRVMLRRAVVDSNPGNHGIVEPWDVRASESLGYDNPYSLYDSEFRHPVDPQRS